MFVSARGITHHGSTLGCVFHEAADLSLSGPLRASRGGFGACVGEPRRALVVRFNGTRCDTWVGFLHEAVAYVGLTPSTRVDSVVIEQVT